MKPTIKFDKCIKKSLQLVFPRHCLLCGSSAGTDGVCAQCTPCLPWCKNDDCCRVCGVPVTSNPRHQRVCGQCQIRIPYYDKLSAAFWYEPPINHFVTQYKYFKRWEYAQTLVALTQGPVANSDNYSAVVPVPSHPSRVRQRGFNAVYELARLFKRQYNIDFDTKLVRRVKNTQPQTGKSKSQRRHNLRNAFEVIRPIKLDHVWIFDEVVTTGATVNEISRCLKRAGVEKVSVWTLARTRDIRMK